MAHKNWLNLSFNDIPRKEEEKNEQVRFWNEFYTHLLSQNTNEIVQHSNTNTVKYKETIFDILENAKDRFPLRDEELREIQQDIEDITLLFDEKSMFRSASDIIKILIREK